ncbi:MAG: hypothetical protein HY754_14870 [Nitrospirae bacterium]|nr:hypothetical protein [Nitrospirota bacterium]
MAKKSDEIHLTLNLPAGFNINITLDGETYHVQTENGGIKDPVATTHIYHKGEIVYSKKTDYVDLLNTEDYNDKIKDVMERQHRNAIEEFTKKLEQNRKKAEYFYIVKKLLMRKNNKQALKILKDALEELPGDPFIMSYYGYLKATVEKKYDEGIKICKKALESFNVHAQISPDEKPFYTTFYLNLGKAYLAGGEKQSAIEAFNNGLRIDKSNHDLLWELKKLGMRKAPPIPYLNRSNPINKYLGLLIAKLKGR